MSTRQIAPVMSISQKTADRDTRKVSQSDSPEPTATGPQEFTEYSLPKSEKIIDQDGKQYPRPAVRNDPKPDAPRAMNVSSFARVTHG